MRAVLGLVAVTCLLAGAQQAAALTLTPADLIARTYASPANCEVGCINGEFGATLTNPDDLLYKADFRENLPAAEEGTFAGSYATAFSPADEDPRNATITYAGGPIVSCAECYLAVKGGRHTPTYYFYDLSDWNGVETISLVGLWADTGKGAISHVSIWGRTAETSVPEPASVLLLGIGAGAVAYRMRRRAV